LGGGGLELFIAECFSFSSDEKAFGKELFADKIFAERKKDFFEYLRVETLDSEKKSSSVAIYNIFGGLH
jgi:hypothetical protein